MLDIDISRLFPKYLLSDRNGYAMACAIGKALEIIDAKVSEGLDTLQNVDAMPEWRLNELAWEYNLTWYDYNADIMEKRAQIAGAMEYYNRLGTPDAVRRAISDVFGGGQVEEWFTYGGDPYHFRVTTSDMSALYEKRAKFMKIINAVKPLRSTLDNIYYNGGEGTASGAALTAYVGSYMKQTATAR